MVKGGPLDGSNLYLPSNKNTIEENFPAPLVAEIKDDEKFHTVKKTTTVGLTTLKDY